MAWNGFTLAGANSAAASSNVARVSRIPGSMEVWWVAPNGSVRAAFWYDGGAWGGYELAPPGSASPSGGIAAVSRIPGSMEVWFVGANGSIQDRYWYDGGTWQGFELSPPGSAALNGGIAAVSRIPTSMELWFVGADGSIQDRYWYEGANWQGFTLSGPNSASLDGGIAAVCRIPTSMEVWWISANGSGRAAFWYDGGAWGGYELSPPGSASPNGGIAAVSRIPNSMEVWFVGANGSIQDHYWYDGGTWQGFELSPPGSASLTSGIAAVSRVPNSMELWFVGPNGSVQDHYWYDGGNWQGFELSGPGSASPDGGIAAVSRIPGSMETWFVGSDGSIQDRYFYDNAPTRLIDNGPDGAKVTIVVVGDGFAVQDQGAYNTAVDNLLTNGLFGHDFYAANRRAFNLLRINAVSVDSGVTTKTYDAAGNVTATTTRNTALGAIYNGDWAHCWVEDGPDTGKRLGDLLAYFAPEHRLVILLLNNPGFGGCGGGGRATLPLGVTWSTIAHEFGHALGGLADEYHQQNNAWTDGEPGEANATINTNRQTLKWGWAVAATTPIPTGGDDYNAPKPTGWDDNQGVGLFEGGHGNFSTGVYRPVVNCRMRSNDPAFCPVCNAAMSAQTSPFNPTAIAAEDAVSDTPADSYIRMTVRVEGDRVDVVDAHQIAGPLVQPATVAHGVAHEVLVNGQRVALGSDPDAGVSRSFSEPGRGPQEHHVYNLDSYELPIRVPTSALHGANPADVTINVVRVEEHPQQALNSMSLIDDPVARTSLIATTNLAQAFLPDALREVMLT